MHEHVAGLASANALKSLYAGLDPNKETVVYCQSGVRAAETAAVLETLGFNKAKVYDASWLGYASRLDAPVERETFFKTSVCVAHDHLSLWWFKERQDLLSESALPRDVADVHGIG